MNDPERQIIDGLQELTEKLRSGEPIPATRVELCPACDNDPVLRDTCETCHGRGFIRYGVEL